MSGTQSRQASLMLASTIVCATAHKLANRVTENRPAESWTHCFGAGANVDAARVLVDGDLRASRAPRDAGAA